MRLQIQRCILILCPHSCTSSSAWERPTALFARTGSLFIHFYILNLMFTIYSICNTLVSHHVLFLTFHSSKTIRGVEGGAVMLILILVLSVLPPSWSGCESCVEHVIVFPVFCVQLKWQNKSLPEFYLFDINLS